MYNEELANTGIGLTILGMTFDMSLLIAVAATMVIAGVTLIRFTGKKA